MYGGSDAVDVVCPPSEGFNGKAASLGKQRQYNCTTNDAFDHTVLTGDGNNNNCKNEFPPFVGSTSAFCGPDYTDRTRVDARTQLDMIDDEEFDIPPLFDDTKYASEDIPDLDTDETRVGIWEGRLFDSKEECQIALAIYAIKGMFHFKQSRTKRHYFVSSCVDKRCDWRVLAKEVGSFGYYEIKKAKLEHTCCLDTRNAYKRKASSTVIAAIFKAKYGDPDNGPRAADLQQLVLEELRVQASYMKCYMAKEQATIEV